MDQSRILRTALLGALLLGLGTTASAATIWNEAVDGDLSTDPTSPTALTFGVGSNSIIGSMSAPQDIRDYITFTIGAGQQLSAIVLLQYEDLDVGGPGNRGFHAINEGDTSFIPSGSTVGDFLGGDHLDPLAPGTDVLAILATAPLAGTGFDAPLGPGTYSYLVQQTGPQLTGYTLDFVVTAIPVPAALPLMVGALGALGFVRRRRGAG